MFIRNDTEFSGVSADEKAAVLAFSDSEQEAAALRVIDGVPIDHIEPPHRPRGHCYDLQRGAFDRERAWNGRMGDRVMVVLFLAVLLGIAAGWFGD